MEDLAKHIKQTALEHGACRLVDSADSFADLAELFFSAPGLEFCAEAALPTLSDFRKIAEDVAKFNIYVDAGKMEIDAPSRVAIVGNTEADIRCSGADDIFTIVAAHGANAVIHAVNYAVVQVIKIGECECTIDLDQTAILL